VALIFALPSVAASVAVDRVTNASPAALPVEFEKNQGQHDPAVRYLARAQGYQMYLTAEGAVVAVGGTNSAIGSAQTSIQLRFGGSNSRPELEAQEPSEHRTNYFIGNEPSDFRTDIPNYGRVLYRRLYPGVDLAFYGKDGGIEYDLMLQPGADPDQIELDLSGASKLEVDASGDLLIHTSAGGVLTQHRPAAFQERNGHREAVDASYQILDGGKVRFQLAGYDRTRALTIDPVLSYSTYIGGYGSWSSLAIAVDASGNAYVASYTDATNWPVVSAYQASKAGTTDVVVTKLNPQGTGLLYSTYIGGKKALSQSFAIAIDGSGNAYIAGYTSSNSYPTTTGAFSGPITGGGVFVTKLNPAGNGLVFSTYLKNANGTPSGIAVDGSGNVVVAGTTLGTITTTSGALQTSKPSPTSSIGFISKLNPTGTALVFSTYLGGSSADGLNGLALDSSGNSYVTGYANSSNFPITAGAYKQTKGLDQDAFVSKINSAGTALLYSTFLGGSDREGGNAIAVDASGRAFVTGQTFSSNFPVLNGAGPGSTTAYGVGFITVLNPDGASLYWSTLFGGNGCLPIYNNQCTQIAGDLGTAIAVDPSGTNVYVAGSLSSTQGVGPYLSDPVQSDLNGRSDAFVTYLQADAFSSNQFNTRYATRLGGGDDDTAYGVANDPKGNVYVVGGSNQYGAATGDDFPTTKGAYRVAYTQGRQKFVFSLSMLNAPVTLTGSCIGANSQLTASTALSATGNVIFKDGTTNLATVPISNGRSAWSGAFTPGVHKLTAARDSDGAVSQPIFCTVVQ
jgi:hypothetical protein